ncbi:MULTISPECIES: hypothetical protein [unclassified Pseudomonas]|uniref:hypothetical protein n=1 Tax=unclassified Pseudomonas TaxID=196821 RepID=UPI00147292D0|nr:MULTISPECIES: hypothetical protein [unclassified Pseudomonas]NMX94294.1 hypothetical protein [Pseudomonas sp. WS 5086]NMY48140.1 hypothetical protein [Pseudomonas sp. WS 5027]
MRTSLVLTGTFLLSACTTDRMTDPAIVTSVNEKSAFTALTTTADRRIFIINNATDRTCGEPPAGVAENISASLSNSLSVALKTQAGDPSAKNSFAESAAKTVANVSQKTQGLMLYEAMSSGLCMAFANDPKMTATQYIDSLINAGKVAAPLIESELAASRGKIGPTEKTLEPGGSTKPAQTPLSGAGTSVDGATAAAVAAGSTAVALATQSAEAGQAAGVAISQSMPAGASNAEQQSVVKQVTAQTVTQVSGSSKEGQKAAKNAVDTLSQSSNDAIDKGVTRNVLNALENMNQSLK